MVYADTGWVAMKDAGDYVDLGVIETHFADSWSEVVDTLQAIKDYKSQAIAA